MKRYMKYIYVLHTKSTEMVVSLVKIIQNKFTTTYCYFFKIKLKNLFTFLSFKIIIILFLFGSTRAYEKVK